MRIKNYFEGKAIRKFMDTLRPELRKRYGGNKKYTKGQIEATIQSLNLDKKYAGFALFMFCKPTDGQTFEFTQEEIQKYEGYRDERLAGSCGNCGSNFDGEGSCGSGGGGE